MSLKIVTDYCRVGIARKQKCLINIRRVLHFNEWFRENDRFYFIQRYPIIGIEA